MTSSPWATASGVSFVPSAAGDSMGVVTTLGRLEGTIDIVVVVAGKGELEVKRVVVKVLVVKVLVVVVGTVEVEMTVDVVVEMPVVVEMTVVVVCAKVATVCVDASH